MTVLGFTGTRGTANHRAKLNDYLRSEEMRDYLSSFDSYVTGACNGWDALIGRYLAQEFSDRKHTVVVPYNQSQVDFWWFESGYDYDSRDTLEVVYMPEGTDYRSRNIEIVNRSDQIFYCADYPEDHSKSKRSGTWMTKRIAEAAGVPVSGITLNTETK